MKLNPLKQSPRKATLQALAKTYRSVSPLADKQQAARANVDKYLVASGDTKLYAHAQKLLDDAIAKPDLDFRRFVLDDTLVPTLCARSAQFDKAEQLMDAINIENLVASTTAAANKGVMVGLGFKNVNDGPLRQELIAMMRECGVKHQLALAYACELSAGGLDAVLAYSSTKSGRRMMQKLAEVPGQIAENLRAMAQRREPEALSEKLQRKRDKLDQFLKATGTDVAAQYEALGVDKNQILADLARAFSERDLDHALAWQKTDAAKELVALQAKLQTVEGLAFFNRPENQERYMQAVRSMEEMATRPDLANSLIGLVLNMREAKPKP